ncbi:aldehyde oxidase 2-like [Ascaphus truei]|uniref:aldehyde oxidase 2-like n=1 Tax=Ascaphus truei TaxID=8439 RepID=UPI003F5A9F8C
MTERRRSSIGLMSEDQRRRMLVLQGDKSTWITPSDLSELLQLKSLYPMAPLVVGNTFIGPQVKLTGSFYPVIISPARVPELSIVSYTEKGITIGAACSLALVRSILSETVSQLPEEKNKIFCVLLQQLTGPQIRSEASLGGSILSGSSDWELNPILAVGNCSFNLASQDRKRQITLSQLLFDESGKATLRPEEILISINVPFSKKWEFVSAFRQVQRWGNASPAIAAMRAVLREGTDLVLGLNIYYGGSESACAFAKSVSEELTGRRWNEAMLDEACRLILEEVPLRDYAVGGMVDYERTLTISFLFKFYLQVSQELKQAGNFLHNTISDNHYTTTYSTHNKKNSMGDSNGFHMYQDGDRSHPWEDTNGNQNVRQSHVLQTIVEEENDDETSAVDGELFLALVTSNKPHAKIISIHTAEAFKVPGVFDVITSGDVPGTNESDLFAEHEVHYIGQVICAVVADTQVHANLGASRIQINYDNLEPVLLSIQDSIKHNSFFEPIRKLEQGNIEEAFKSADHTLEGEDHMGGQDDLELGTQSMRVIPRGEDNEMEVEVSTQDPASVRAAVASALNVPSDFILCHGERGGADLRGQCPNAASLAAVAAVAAHKTGQIVRWVLGRRQDTSISRHQHPFLGKYKVGFMNDGRIVALDVTYYFNAGYTPDESFKVLTVSLLSPQNAYSIANIRCCAAACRTNLPSNTFGRGYSFPQTAMVSELWIDAVADRCRLPSEKVRQMNLHKATSHTSFKREFDATGVLKCWDECVERSSYHNRRVAAKDYNKQHPWKKKGLSIIPVMFPVGFIADFLSQAAALVHIYRDGWVLVAPGGNEVEQDSYTQIMQVASRELRIPVSYVQICETSTMIASDTPVTAPSGGAKVQSMAVQDACQTLLQRLEPIISMNPEATWKDWVQEAFRLRISLSATGYYRSPNTALDWDSKEGTESPDFIFGAVCSEVEIDCRTGDHKNLRTDVVMDVGSSINKALNIEQIEGAFVQGLALFTSEDLKYSLQESLNTTPSDKSQTATTCSSPGQLNVSLLPSPPNPYIICSYKGIEEASLFLGCSVFFAIKDAVLAARDDTGLTGTISLPIPARPQHVRIACGNHLTNAIQIRPGEECTDNHTSET